MTDYNDPRTAKTAPFDLRKELSAANRPTGRLPPPEEQACLVMRSSPKKAQLGVRFPIRMGMTTLGRSTSNDIELADESVSKVHAQFVNDHGNVSISDVGSTNGTRVNDALVDTQQLQDGDVIQVGPYTLRIFIGSNLESSYQEEIYQLHILDELTHVFNRGYLFNWLCNASGDSEASEEHLSMILMDLDNFEVVNAGYGRDAGDQVLRELCDRLQSRLREGDVLARFQEDAFAVILPKTSLKKAVRIAEQLRELVEAEPFHHEHKKMYVTASAGVVSRHYADVDAPTYLDEARRVVKAAKAQGRNRVVSIADAEITQEIRLAGIVIFPEITFGKKLLEHDSWSTFSVGLHNRIAVASMTNGAELLYRLEHALDNAVAGAATRARGLIGRKSGLGGVLVIAMPTGQKLNYENLAGKIKKKFEASKAHKNVPQVRLNIGALSKKVQPERVLTVAVEALGRRSRDDLPAFVNLPQPIALAIQMLSASTNETMKASQLIRLHETITRWMVTLCLAHVRPHFKDKMVLRRRVLDAIRRPVTQGTWCGILQDTATVVREIYKKSPDEALTPLARLLVNEKKDATQAIGTLEEFVAARNKYVHGTINESIAKHLAAKWAGPIRDTIQTLYPIHEIRPLVVHETRPASDDEEETATWHGVKWTVGGTTLLQPSELVSERRLFPGLVYGWVESTEHEIKLDPFVIFASTAGQPTKEVLFLDQLTKTEITYANLRTGDYRVYPIDENEVMFRRVKKAFALDVAPQEPGE